MPAPADAQEPRVRCCDRRVENPGEELTRRCRIEPRDTRQGPVELREVATSIEEHVCQSVPHLSGRAEHMQVVAIGENCPAAGEHSVHRARDARGDRLHAAGQIVLARRLYERVNVVVLDRVRHETEAPAFAHSSEAALQLSYEPVRAKRAQSTLHLQRDVTRMSRCQRCSHEVRIPGIGTPLAAGAGSASSPVRFLAQIERPLPSRPR